MSVANVAFRDLKHVLWGPTIKLVLLRALSGGVVWAALGLLIRPPTMLWYQAILGGLLGAPLLSLLYLPIGLVCGALSQRGVPFIGLGTFPLLALVVVGDPLLWLAAKSKPDLVPIEDFKFFNLAAVLFVLDKDFAPMHSPTTQ